MNYKLATKKQLLQIVLDEQCPIIYKFEAANEYKRRDTSGFTKIINQEKIIRRREG